jgi:hypothetical protein
MQASKTDQMQAFEKMLALHDWHFNYSDDHSVWRRGKDSLAAIINTKALLIKENIALQSEIDLLINKYKT